MAHLAQVEESLEAMQTTICQGSRANLPGVQSSGGPSVPAVGWSMPDNVKA